MNNKTFNLILTGVGGQGIITLLQVIDEAAVVEGLDVKSSELHGLSQRGGSVEAHVRFGKKVYSPMVSNGQADLILALETLEGLRESAKAGKQTKLLVNEYILPLMGAPAKEEIIKQLKATQNDLYLVPASADCREKLQNEVVCTLYMVGYSVAKKLMPLKKESVLTAIKNVIPEKYLDLNIKAFELGYNG
ncbi:MAG: indolepyruvate oxidoreductase subunit beta [Candidatus Staskawiczbacteria bacterium]|jgi:indolepyruvate ferredoxin oxidoreductase beta subunit